MRLGQDVLSDLPRALAHEWRFANGLGGSMSGTAAGASARRDQALLASASPAGRVTVVLLGLDERLTTAGGARDLATRLLSDGQVKPAGHRFMTEFRADPLPSWTYGADEVEIQKSLFAIHGHNAVAIVYRHLQGPAARLTVSPLLVARSPRELQQEARGARGVVQGLAGRVRLEVEEGRPCLTLWHNGSFLPARLWQRGIVHPGDRAIGLEGSEDALLPGYVEATLHPGGALHLVAGTEEDLFRALAMEGRLGTPPPRTLAECVAALERHERTRLAAAKRVVLQGADFTARQAAAARGGPGETEARRPAPLVDETDPWVGKLAGVLIDGLARRGARLTLLRELPGGEERGAEALRSLAGLIAIRAFEDAAAVLRGYAEYLDEGLAPTRFDPDDGRPFYKDADVSLWMVRAGELLARRSEDMELVKDGLYPILESVMQHYRGGTRQGIRVDHDGLLVEGDLKRADTNALWYHALVAMAQLARLSGRKENGAFYLAWARDHQKRFNEALWDEERGRLHLALGPSEQPVAGVTPSQLLAVSLAPSLLPEDRSARLVATVERELLAPSGLRTGIGAAEISPEWLGTFFTAHLRVHGRSPASQARVRDWLEALRPPEVSLPVVACAELLRLWIEELAHAEEPAAIA